MSVLAQCGYGRGNKIEQGFDDGVIKGAIFSPRDERRERLEQAVREWGNNYPNALIMFDPQFYAAKLNNPRDGHLTEYDYYNNNQGLGRTHFSGTRIQKYVKECLDYQHNTFTNNITYMISPTILFDSFRDSWSQIALNLAAESAEYHSKLDSPRPLLVSLVISETAFQTMDAVDEFLDALTEINIQGFYIIIRRNSASIQNAMESMSFGRFMYFCHVLTTINEYDVVVGYSDWHSFLLETAGVTYTATGWHQNLRQFSLARFQPATGGRRPRKRYSSIPLLSCPMINPELEDIFLANLLHYVLSGSDKDHILQNGPTAGQDNWSDEISCLTHWYSLNKLSQRLSSLNSQLERIRESEGLIQSALTLYGQLNNYNISFDPATGPAHILEWRDSLREFCSITGLK